MKILSFILPMLSQTCMTSMEYKRRNLKNVQIILFNDKKKKKRELKEYSLEKAQCKILMEKTNLHSHQKFPSGVLLK